MPWICIIFTLYVNFTFFKILQYLHAYCNPNPKRTKNKHTPNKFIRGYFSVILNHKAHLAWFNNFDNILRWMHIHCQLKQLVSSGSNHHRFESLCICFSHQFSTLHCAVLKWTSFLQCCARWGRHTVQWREFWCFPARLDQFFSCYHTISVCDCNLTCRCMQ